MRRFMSILAILLALLSFTACNPDTKTPTASTGSGAEAGEEEVIGAIRETLSVMAAGMSPANAGVQELSVASPQARTIARAIPDDMNFSEIFYALLMSDEAFETQYSMMFAPEEMGEHRITEMSRNTSYGMFSASFPVFSQTGSYENETITQHGENLTLRLDDTLEFKIHEYDMLDKAGDTGRGDTTITCSHMEYTDKRQYTDGPLVSFSFKAESTGESIKIDDTTEYILMDVTISNLVYKGTPRTVTPAINEAANEFMNYPGSVN